MKKRMTILLSVLLLLVCSGCSNQSSTNGQGNGAEMISIKGVYYGALSSDYDKSSYKSAKGMTDCIVVFEFNNDDTNREMPSTSYANSDEVSLSINTSNKYDAFTSVVQFAENLDRYSEMNQVLNYGNVLGGSDPIMMYALFFINPNDFKSSDKITLTIDGITGTCSPDLAKEISYVNDAIAEIDGSENEMISEFLWRCDAIYKNAEKTAKYAAQNPGSDYKLVSECMTAIFSDKYGVNLNKAANWGGDSTLRRPPELVEDIRGFDKETLLGACPDIADEINGIIDASEQYASAIVNTSTTVSSLSKIADELENNYIAILNYFSLKKK